MKYANQPWRARFATLGDTAEAIYEAAKPLGPTTRWGFRRPEGVAVSKFPSAVAHTPDYVTYQNYVEVVGMGRDGLLKSIKVEKWEGLKLWQKVAKLFGMQGVMFFIWNSHLKEFAIVTFTDMAKLVKKAEVKAFEEDGNQYYEIPWEQVQSVAVWSERVEEPKES